MPSNHRAWRPVSPSQTTVLGISQVFHMGMRLGHAAVLDAGDGAGGVEDLGVGGYVGEPEVADLAGEGVGSYVGHVVDDAAQQQGGEVFFLPEFGVG